MSLCPFTEDAVGLWTEPKYYNTLHPITERVSITKVCTKRNTEFRNLKLELGMWKESSLLHLTNVCTNYRAHIYLSLLNPPSSNNIHLETSVISDAAEMIACIPNSSLYHSLDFY